MSRRWTEESAHPPLDLRLIPSTLAVWAACLVALWAGPGSWWMVCVPVALLGVVAAVAKWRRISARALIAPLVCGAAALILAMIMVGSARADPLFAAAVDGDWVVVDIVLETDPIAVPVDGFAVDPASGSDAGARAAVESAASSGILPNFATSTAGSDTELRRAETRWRVSGRATSAVLRGVATSAAAPVTVFGIGADWAALAAGQTVRARGPAAVDTFRALPSVTLRARGAPELLAGPSRWLSWAGSARAALAKSALVLDADQGGLLRGLVVGDVRGIGPELSADAKISGLTHLVAVSGAHMAIAAAAILLLVRRFGPRISGCVVVVTFAALVIVVGPVPSVLRAVVMGLIGVLGAVLGRSRTALPALAAAVFVLLFLDPSLAASVGFTLSVQATAGLILLAPVLTRALERRRVPSGWAMLLALPVAAQLATAPVIAAISGSISLAAIPANVAVAPVVTPALLVGFACLIIGPIWPVAGEWLAWVDGPMLGWIATVAHRLARWPWATVPWSASTVGVLLLGAIIVVVFTVFQFRRVRAVTLAAAAGTLVILAMAHVLPLGWPASGWLITMCDVGQGDGIVLATDAPGVAIVVDAGPESEPMDACLDRLGVDTIAMLVITHLHADHVGGLDGVFDGRAVSAIAIGPDRSAAAPLAHIRDLARSRGIPLLPLTSGMYWSGLGVELGVLGPVRQYHGTESDPNNESVVLMATSRGVRMLLTGDIERPAQQSLVDAGVDLAADVLKQPHHGSSKLLPSFVAAVAASVALIGVGAGNDYGHPAPSALRIDAQQGIGAILRTDRDGDIQVVLTEAGIGVVHRGPDTRSLVSRRSGGG